MQSLAYIDLSRKKATESIGGSAFKFPPLTFGGDITLALRFAERVNGETVEVSREVESFRASIGRIDARPESGKFAIKVGNAASVIGTNVTTEIAWNAKPETVEAALNVLTEVGTTFGAATVDARADSWLVTFAGEPEAVPISVASGNLFPASMLRVRTSQVGEEIVHDLRLIQAPVASTSTSERILPPPPSVTVLREGGTESGVTWSESQQLFIPPTFRGIYQIRRGSKTTINLDRTDGPEDIAKAMNDALVDETTDIFTVTLPTDNTFVIAFDGTMTGIDQDLLTIDVFSAPEGDLTFTLPIESSELYDLLRKSDKVTLPIEIDAVFVDPNDPLITYPRKLLSDTVTISRELQWEGLETVAAVDWQRKPVPRDYKPFGSGQISNGQLHYAVAVGNASDTVFVIDHDLDTPRVDVVIHSNLTTGAPLVYGTDYTYTRTSNTSLTVTFAVAPALDAHLVTVLGLALTSYFDAHTHTIADVTNLTTTLDGLDARIAALEAKVAPADNFQQAARTSNFITRHLPKVWSIPRARSLPVAPPSLRDWNPFEEGSPLRDIRLLPAVNVASGSIEVLPPILPAPDATYRDRVFYSATARPDFPGGTLPEGGYAACDGRDWYRVRRETDAETTWYPTLFEVELFRLSISPDELALRSQLNMLFGFETALLAPLRRPGERRAAGRCSLLIERGVRSVDASPSTTGSNIDTHFSGAVVMSRHDFDLTEVPASRTFGLTIKRSSADVITAEVTKFLSAATVSAPPTADFVLRARIARVDFEDMPEDARGILVTRGLDVSMSGIADNNIGLLTIS